MQHHVKNLPIDISLLDAALDYTRRGWRVFPLHTPQANGCSCEKQDCQHPGKHPRTPHGFQDATRDQAAIREWWNRWPTANIGVVTGAASGIVVLDIDPRHGGDDSFATLEREQGELPRTVESLTGGGGRHLYFAHPGGTLRSKLIAPGIELKGDGGYVVAPPSTHVSGRRYIWELSSHPDDVALAPLPRWLARTTRPVSAGNDNPTPPCICEGARDKTLTSLAGVMRRRGMTEEAILAALLEENQRRCDPPLPEVQVRKIARSIGRYPPSEPQTTETTPEGPAEREPIPAAPWPDPPAPAASHGLAGDLVAAIEPHTEADRAALLLSLLVAYGNIVGRGPHFVADAAKHHMNLYVILVGTTSRSRKGSSWRQVMRPLETVAPDWARDRVQFGLSSGEGLIWAVRDPIERQEPVREKGRVVDYQSVVEDPGVEDKRLLVQEAEFASILRVMGREGNILSAIIRMAWDTGDLRVLTKNSPARATGAHVSLIGHITREELLRYLDSTEAGNGFGNRFLWVCVKRSKLLPEGGYLEQVNFGPLVRRLGDAIAFAEAVGEMRRDELARALWYEVYPTLSAGLPGLFGAIVARAEAQVMRLACIYALLDASKVVRREHLKAALAVWRYCEDSARFIFGDALGDPVADEILQLLRRAEGGVTRTEIYNHFGRNCPASRIARALSSLLDYGLARSWKEPPAGGEGRPSERWEALEKLSTHKTHETH